MYLSEATSYTPDWFLTKEFDEDIVEEYEEDTCEGTWFLFDEPGMDDRLKEAGDSLQEMFDKLETQPCEIWGDKGDKETIFLARYEFPVLDEEFYYSKAPLRTDSVGFIDFLGGLPYGVAEIMGVVGELSTEPDDVEVIETSSGKISPPIPEDFFEGFTNNTELYNLIWLVTTADEGVILCAALAENLKGTPKPENPHWWYRADLGDGEDIHFPVPGEFLALAPRIMPYLACGNQKSSPFLFSGNWMETVHYTNCKVLEVIKPTKETPYPTYKVQYRKYGGEGEGEITAKPTDFAEYKVDDRVAVVRNEGSEKTSWTWKELQEFDEESWLIAPFDFYGKLTEDGGGGGDGDESESESSSEA